MNWEKAQLDSLNAAKNTNNRETLHELVLPVGGLGELCVIIADDSGEDRLLIRNSLQRSSLVRYQIFESADVDTTLELTTRYRPDAIILSSYLPTYSTKGRRDAVAVMGEISQLMPSVAFIIMTGEADQNSAVRVMKAGASDFIVKDHSLRDIIRVDRGIQSAVARKRLERDLKTTVEQLRQRNRELELLNEQLEHLNQKLWKLSHTDELTGYFNRRFIVTQMEQEISRSLRYNHPLSVVLVDIDHFKKVNDTYGHLSGDKALQAVANLFRGRLRDTDLIGRFGGEEFLLVLPHTDLAGAEVFCHRLRDQVENQPIDIGTQNIFVTCSFGITNLMGASDTVNRLLRRADRNLYRAKAKGRNCVVAEVLAEDQEAELPVK